MSEQFLTQSIHRVCENLVAVKRHGWWKNQGHYVDFEHWASEHYRYSKTRTRLYLRFGKFCTMCRDERLPLPASPELVQEIMSTKQGGWMHIWRMCVDMEATTADAIDAALEHQGVVTNKRLPQHVLDNMAAKRAGKNLASIQNPDAVTHPGKEWESDEAILKAVTLRENAQ